MMYSSWFGNLGIYFDNLSTYYVFTILLSFLAVFLTWWFQETQSKHLQDDINNMMEEEEESHSAVDNESIVTHYKKSRQKAIAEQLSAGLTKEQLQEEKEVEKKQLEAIFQLLKEQEEKFHVNSMEELEDQLRLYRR